MKQSNDGDCAFPGGLAPGGYTHKGMTLRDYFAGQAIIGLLTSSRWSDVDSQTDLKHNLVQDAFCVADMMLIERARPKEET